MIHLNAENLLQEAISRSTPEQAAQLQKYIGAGWKLSKVDGYAGCDAILCIWLKGTGAYIDWKGLVTRVPVGQKSIRYTIKREKLGQPVR